MLGCVRTFADDASGPCAVNREDGNHTGLAHLEDRILLLGEVPVDLVSLARGHWRQYQTVTIPKERFWVQ